MSYLILTMLLITGPAEDTLRISAEKLTALMNTFLHNREKGFMYKKLSEMQDSLLAQSKKVSEKKEALLNQMRDVNKMLEEQVSLLKKPDKTWLKPIAYGCVTGFTLLLLTEDKSLSLLTAAIITLTMKGFAL